jgi:HD-like signal output (HDOD) protein
MKNLWFNCECGSTLMIKKGKFDWYSPEKSMSDEAASVFNKLGALEDLPHIPTPIMNLQTMLSDDNIAPKDLAAEVRKDPFIAANVIQVAENLRSTRNPDTKPFEKMEHAIVYMGAKALNDIVLAAALRSFKIPEGDFDSDGFWEESYICGAVTEHLADRFKININKDKLYLAGSLCNIGKIVTAICFPEQSSKVNKDVNNRNTLGTWRSAEIGYGFPEHTILGEIGGAIWGLPDFVIDTCRYHHRTPKPAGSGPMTIPEVTGFALQMTHWALLQPHRIEEELLDAYKSKLKLDDNKIDEIANEISEIRSKITSTIEVAKI